LPAGTKKKASLIDDDAPVSFDELEENERDFVSFFSSVVNFVIFVVLSFLI